MPNLHSIKVHLLQDGLGNLPVTHFAGMGKRSNATGMMNNIYGLLGSKLLLLTIRRFTFGYQSIKDLLNMGKITLLHHYSGYMWSSQASTAIGFFLYISNGNIITKLLYFFHYVLNPYGPTGSCPSKFFLEKRVGTVHKITKDMDIKIFGTEESVYFHTGNKFNSIVFLL